MPGSDVCHHSFMDPGEGVYSGNVFGLSREALALGPVPTVLTMMFLLLHYDAK